MIRKIEIHNFRSIERMELECKDVTTLIGKNDAGKSNVLRALNLFFNGETDYGRPFDFKRDWNRNAKKRSGKAKEVQIILTLAIPQNYKGSHRSVKWKKVWREAGFRREEKAYTNKKPIGGRSRISLLLDRFRFCYVPAVKDRNFLTKLQGDLYEVLAEVVEKDLRDSAKSFENSIKAQLQQLHKAGAKIIGSESSLRLPENLRSIFETLQFFGENGIPLQQRGDGIQMRHIPEILKFMGEKHNSARRKGTPNYTYIWGFEEPENSVEMSACFNMREALENTICTTNSTTQIFLTTHSPIFYWIGGEKNSKVNAQSYVVQKSKGDKIYSEAKPVTNLEQLDEDMGLIPLVAPHIEKERSNTLEAERKLKEAEIALGKVELKPTLFVEGKLDKQVVERALSLFFHEEAKQIRVLDCGNNHGVISHAKAWLKVGLNLPAVALTDRDRKKTNSPRRGGPSNELVIYLEWESNNLSGDLTNSLPADLESCYSNKIWDYAHRQQQWLIPSTRPVEAGLFAKNPNLPSENRIVNQFTEIGKKEAADYIIKLSDDDAREALIAMELTLKKIVQHLVPSK